MTENTQQHTQTQTAAEQDAKRQAYLAKRRKYYAEHPADNLRHRLNSALHFLAKGGFMAIPIPADPPWTEEEAAEILVNIAHSMGFHPDEQGEGL